MTNFTHDDNRFVPVSGRLRQIKAGYLIKSSSFMNTALGRILTIWTGRLRQNQTTQPAARVTTPLNRRVSVQALT
ncbi:MAG: hypothetical protein WAW41_21565, partial [Methylobacter sp.]